MLPSSCLDGSVTPVGPGQNPQDTGAVQRREAVGCSQGLKMSPQKQQGQRQRIQVFREDIGHSSVLDKKRVVCNVREKTRRRMG